MPLDKCRYVVDYRREQEKAENGEPYYKPVTSR